MRIAQLLHHAYHQEHSEFIKAVHQQLLKREPEEREVTHYLNSLEVGLSKNEIIVELLTSEEASLLYRRQPGGLSETVADKLQGIMKMDQRMIVVLLYAEVLCRCVDGDGYESHLNSLKQGTTPIELIRVFLSCEEWLQLLQSDNSLLERRMD